MADSLFQTDFPPDEFAARRGRIFQAIGKDAHALIQGAPPLGAFEMLRQSNQFYYCCGIEEPEAYLLLDGTTRQTTLYLPHRPEKAEQGQALTAEDADLVKRLAGVDAVCGPEAMGEHLSAAAAVFTPHHPAEGWKGTRWAVMGADKIATDDPWDAIQPRQQRLIDHLKTRHPQMEVHDLSPILDQLRSIKSPREIDLLRRAGSLAAQAVTEAMRSTRPGVFEYQLGALADYLYGLHGARGYGYRHIIASGANAWHGHYFRNDCQMTDGDILLMDTAPDYHYYTSDIGRMWPVNGTYAPWQRELYGFIVEYHKVLLARIRPGATADEIHDEAAAEMAKVVERTQFSKDIYTAAAHAALEFRGHLSHAVGMAVHDSGGYRAKPLSPGVVFSVDPQMRVPEEKLYIRVEDTVVVTEDGIENLTQDAPLELDDIEALMKDGHRPLPLLPQG